MINKLGMHARPAVLFGRGHVPGARSIPYSFVTPLTAAGAKALNAYRAIFVYCDSPGDRLASLLAAQMRERGLRQASVVSGGWAALRRLLPSATAPGSQPASRAADEDEEETMEDLLR